MHSQQPSGVVQNWSTLQCSKQNTEQCGYDHGGVCEPSFRCLMAPGGWVGHLSVCGYAKILGGWVPELTPPPPVVKQNPGSD